MGYRKLDKRQSRQPKPGNSRDKAMTREGVRKRATVNDCLKTSQLDNSIMRTFIHMFYGFDVGIAFTSPPVSHWLNMPSNSIGVSNIVL